MKKFIYIILLSIFTLPVFSQNSIFSTQYSIGFGVGDVHDYAQPASFRGFTMDYRKLIQPNIGVGFDLGWNVFYQKMDYDTYTTGNISYSGKQYRYSNHVPFLFAADYYLKPEQDVNPFVGLGLGINYTLRNTEMGLYSFENDAWQFGLRPELGVIFETGGGVGVSISGKYFYGFKSSLPAQSYFTLNIGIALVK